MRAGAIFGSGWPVAMRYHSSGRSLFRATSKLMNPCARGFKSIATQSSTRASQINSSSNMPRPSTAWVSLSPVSSSPSFSHASNSMPMPSAGGHWAIFRLAAKASGSPPSPNSPLMLYRFSSVRGTYS